MAKVKYTHRVIETGKRNAELTMTLIVDYDNESNSVDEVLEVWVTKDSQRSIEMKQLMEDLPGEPLEAIIAGVDWNELYKDQYSYQFAEV